MAQIRRPLPEAEPIKRHCQGTRVYGLSTGESVVYIAKNELYTTDVAYT